MTMTTMMMMATRRGTAVAQWWVPAAIRMAAGQRAWSSSFTGTDGRSSGVETCGRGDKKTKKGKRFKGSYGNSRPSKDKMMERLKDKVEVPRSTPWPLPFKLI